MARFFRFHCPDLPRHAGQRVELPAAEVRHASTVLRRTAGAVITLFDGVGRRADASLSYVDKRTVTAELLGDALVTPEPRRLAVAIATPKAGLEEIVPMLAEIGVTELIMMDCERGDAHFRANQTERLSRVAIAAAKQCGSDWLMRISGPTPFEEVAELAGAVLCHIDGKPAVDLPEAPVLLVGPEGGWSPAEVQSAGPLPKWRLPGHVLRTGTAAVVAASLARGAQGGNGTLSGSGSE